MSSKRTTAARKRTLKERRREQVETARVEWQDREFGLLMSTGRGGRHQIRWTVDSDPFLALMGLDRLRRSVLESLEVELVASCRYRSAMSWEDIAWALGVSGEALRKRLGGAVEALDPWRES